MKKALAMALGAVLVAGAAAQADAATQVDFKGYYRVNYGVNGNLGYTSDNNLNESFFEHRFNVDVTFQATDEVSVIWRFRAPAGKRFGSGNVVNAAGGDFSTRFIYGQVVQDWGTVRVGRLANGFINQFGLVSLGYGPALDAVGTFIGPFESAGDADGIQYSNTWDNGFGIGMSYVKVTDGFSNGTTANSSWSYEAGDGSDHDVDRFQIEPRFQWDGGGAALNMYYQRDASGNGQSGTAPNRIPAPNAKDVTSEWYINPALMHSWGAFSTHFEGMFVFGKTSYTDAWDGTNYVGVEDSDSEGQGFYLDFDYNYGPGRVNLAGWWVSGNDVDDQTDNDPNNNRDTNARANIVDGNFYPLVVAYSPINAYVGGNSTDSLRDASDGKGVDGAVGVANQGLSFLTGGVNNVLSVGATTFVDGNASGNMWDEVAAAVAGSTNGLGFTADYARRNNRAAVANGQANHWALMLSGQHAFTDEITFNYALAYLALNNPNYSVLDRVSVNNGTFGGASFTTQDKDLGWEIDLGVNVKLLDNLLFTSTAGYMFTGDAYKQLRGYRVTGDATNNFSAQAEWEDADNAYSWFNSLTFSF